MNAPDAAFLLLRLLTGALCLQHAGSPGGRDHAAVETATRAADAALYRAKEAGRDRALVWAPA